MKVLILSIPTGRGHHQTAKAIKSHLEERGATCEILDVFEDVSPMLSEMVDKGYVWLTKRVPGVYGKLYESVENRDFELKAKITDVSGFMNLITRIKLREYIEEFKPDVVVGTHVFACMSINALEKYDGIKVKSIGVVTDFTMHPYWEEVELDYYVMASELLGYSAEQKGIAKEKMSFTGIPVDMKFSKKMPKIEARELLGLENKPTVLIMGGSMGYGNILKHIKQVDRLPIDLQIISVCGYNEKLKKQIDDIKWKKNVVNYGFAENVDLLMDAADCIITKPGGLTMSEAMAKKLPALLVNPIPGQEERNVEFLVNNGVAMAISKTFPVDNAIYYLFSVEWKLKLLESTLEKFAKPNATEDLCNLIFSIGEQE